MDGFPDERVQRSNAEGLAGLANRTGEPGRRTGGCRSGPGGWHPTSWPRSPAVLRLVPIRRGTGWHGAKGLVVPDNISLLTLPPYAPELNPVENVWAYLRANKLAITVFDDYPAIVDACCLAWNRFADDPKTVTSITNRQWAQVNL